MKPLNLAVIAILTVSSGSALATSSQAARLIHAVAPEYPNQAYAQGHQGKVFVKLRIRADGSVENAEVKESSKSRLLDEAALTAVKSWKFSPFTDADGNAIPGNAVVPVDFAKDTHSTLLKKPCSDLNADVSFFRTSYPDKPLADMRIYKLTLGMLVLSEPDMQKKLALAKTFSSTFAAAISKCEGSPADTYGNALAVAPRN